MMIAMDVRIMMTRRMTMMARAMMMTTMRTW